MEVIFFRKIYCTYEMPLFLQNKFTLRAEGLPWVSGLRFLIGTSPPSPCWFTNRFSWQFCDSSCVFSCSNWYMYSAVCWSIAACNTDKDELSSCLVVTPFHRKCATSCVKIHVKTNNRKTYFFFTLETKSRNKLTKKRRYLEWWRILETGTRSPRVKSRGIAGAPYASRATCAGEEPSAEGRGEERRLPVYCATSLKGFTWSGWKRRGPHRMGR